MSKPYIDIYGVGQVMGKALIEYCKEKGIEFSDMQKKINAEEGIFMLGLKDSLGWANAFHND